jgi:hypothetical protein
MRKISGVSFGVRSEYMKFLFKLLNKLNMKEKLQEFLENLN